MSQSLDRVKDVLERARTEVCRVIVGQQSVVDLALVAIFSRQHALVEGVPGIGKTLLVRTLAHVLGSGFSRIQFTPDLMPADITGTSVFHIQQGTFSLVKGPIFTTFLRADEINRATAKTQSALLQAMQERQVTIDGTTHPLAEGFTVFATQNPIEFEGTYPLPEAQKDRFMLKIAMDFPSLEEELRLAERFLGPEAPECVLARGELARVLSEREIAGVREALEDVLLRPELLRYVVEIVRRTRAEPTVLVGCGPRGTQALLLASRTAAALAGRDFVTPDDVKGMALPVLEHRLVLRPEFEIEGLTAREVVERVLREVAVPR